MSDDVLRGPPAPPGVNGHRRPGRRSDPAVLAEGIVFSYPVSPLLARLKGDAAPERRALDGVSFEVDRGEVFGVLGPNGAGKTTLMKILSTILVPSQGRLEVLGASLPGGEESIRGRMGVGMAEYERIFSWRLTGRQNLEYSAAFYRIPRSEARRRALEALETVSLSDKAETPVSEYSTGMKHRLALARALLPRPDVLILDEPTAGLDAKTSQELGQTIRGLAKRGTAVVYTTHRLEEAAALCDRVLILANGKVAAMAAPWELARVAEGASVIEVTVKGLVPEGYEKLRGTGGVEGVLLTGRSNLRVQTRDLDAALASVLDWLRANRLEVAALTTSSASLTDAFLAITEGRIAARPRPSKPLVEFQIVGSS